MRVRAQGIFAVLTFPSVCYSYVQTRLEGMNAILGAQNGKERGAWICLRSDLKPRYHKQGAGMFPALLPLLQELL